MPESNVVCRLCKEAKRGPDKTPELMSELPRLTENKNLPVLVCPHCDGPTLEYARKHAPS